MAKSPVCGVCGIQGHRNNAHQFDAGTKRCSRCKEVKPLAAYHRINRRGQSKPNSHCKICERLMGRAFFNSSLRNRMRLLLTNATRANKRLGFATDIDLQYLLGLFERQRGLCGYTGQPMTHISGYDCVSLDQKTPKGGYTRRNIMLCRLHVNLCKRDHTFDSFLQLCQDVTNNQSRAPGFYILSEAA